MCWKELFDCKARLLTQDRPHPRSESWQIFHMVDVPATQRVCKVVGALFPPLLDTELVTRLFGWSVHVHSFIVWEFPYCYFLVFTLDEYFWASFPSIVEVIWFRVGSACLYSCRSTTWAYLGLYKEVRTLRGAWGLHSLAAFAFLIFVKDFHWKTQKFGGKLAKIVLATFWNFKETGTHNT